MPRRYRLQTTRIRAISATVLLLATATLTACVPPGIACPAIRFVYTAPVEVEISADFVGNRTVAACLGAECEPAAIALKGKGFCPGPVEFQSVVES